MARSIDKKSATAKEGLMPMNDVIKFTIAAAGTFGTYLFGGIDQAFQALLLFIALDYITGMVAGWYNKRLSSYRGFRGIVKKVLMLVLVIIAVKIDLLLKLNNTTRAATIYFLIANEGLSVLENLGRAGVKIPAILRKGLEQMNQVGEEKEV